MKVKMKTNAFGPNGAYEEGKKYNIEDEQAKAWIEGEYAEEVREEEEATETPAAETEETKEETIDESDIKHVGGGYWELPNGEKVKGKENAMEALKVLNEGGSNEA